MKILMDYPTNVSKMKPPELESYAMNLLKNWREDFDRWREGNNCDKCKYHWQSSGSTIPKRCPKCQSSKWRGEGVTDRIKAAFPYIEAAIRNYDTETFLAKMEAKRKRKLRDQQRQGPEEDGSDGY